MRYLRRIGPVRYGFTREKTNFCVTDYVFSILCMPLSIMTLDQQKRLFPVADSDDVIETPGKRYCIVSSSFIIKAFKAELHRQNAAPNKPYCRKLAIIEVQTIDGPD
jgi:hypothetical protein